MPIRGCTTRIPAALAFEAAEMGDFFVQEIAAYGGA